MNGIDVDTQGREDAFLLTFKYGISYASGEDRISVSTHDDSEVPYERLKQFWIFQGGKCHTGHEYTAVKIFCLCATPHT